MTSLLLTVLALCTLQARPDGPPADPALEQGQRLIAAGRFLEAERLLEPAVRAQPGNGLAWNQLGTALHAQKRWHEAAEAFGRAHALLPDQPVILANLAASRFELHDYERAAADFRKVLQMAPQEATPLVFLGRIAVARGEDAEAERCFAAATASQRADALAFFHHGLFLFHARRLEEARRAFERTTELAPAFAAGHLNLGLVLQRSGEREAAREHLERFRRLNEVATGDLRLRQRVVAQLKLAQAEMQAGRLDAALAAASRARDEAPRMPIVHRLLAQIYALQGREADRAAAIALAEELARLEAVR